MKKRWFWTVGLVDRQYEAHLALDLAGGDRVRATRMLGSPLFQIAIKGQRGLPPRARATQA